ncbi:MAG: caspase family protein [Saprospiraceae bacterium]|nr:caspase family protein [Saprospiraceae bacterium]
MRFHVLYRFLLFGSFLFPLLNGTAQQKKALVVAISNYPQNSGFRSINSVNDLPLIENALLKLGFKESDIKIIKEESATKKKIVSTLEDDFLNSLKPGDIAYFHFSGHGQQVQDLNGDELDGYDEALVPYDAFMEFVPGLYEGENHLLDDEIQVIFSKIRLKLGSKGHFLTTIDACHSGTSTRHIGCARGTDFPLEQEGYKKQLKLAKQDQNQSESSIVNETKMASMVSFFGSIASQLNYEIQAEDGKNYGALSYAFSKAMNSISAGSSYQQLFDRIRIIIGMHINNQIPEASGQLNQPILGGKFLGTPNYYLVKEWQNNNNVIVDAGFLNGITPGTIVGFYPPETRDPKNARPIAIGTVKESSGSSSKVEIPDGLRSEDCQQAWVIVKEENFGDLKIDLQLKGEFTFIDSTLFEELFALPYLNKVSENPDLILIEDNNDYALITKHDIQITRIKKTSSRNDLFYKLNAAITQFGQSQYIRKLTQENIQIKLVFDLLLVSRGGIKVSELFSRDSLKDHLGNIKLKLGDVVKIQVTNTGTKPAYYTLLDIQPDNKTNVLFPKANESPADYYLSPGSNFIIPTSFKIEPPLGQELFKLIATRNPINLRPLAQRRSITQEFDKDQDPFEKLFSQSFYEPNTRGATNASLPAGQVNIFSLHFLIEK